MGHLGYWLREGTAFSLMLPALAILIQPISIVQAQTVPGPLTPDTVQQRFSQPSASMCFGFAALAPASGSSRHAVCASATLSLRMQSGGRKQRGGQRVKRSDRIAKRGSDQDDEDEEISTYVSCPKCMSDSFIKAEVLGESKRLKCNNCDRSFTATAEQLKDINAVYSSPSPPAAGGSGGFTEDSFFEMFGDKKTMKPPT